MEVVRQICNKVAIIEKGEIAETGMVEAVLKSQSQLLEEGYFSKKKTSRIYI